jgi:inorganic triphosphatase YgiF
VEDLGFQRLPIVSKTFIQDANDIDKCYTHLGECNSMATGDFPPPFIIKPSTVDGSELLLSALEKRWRDYRNELKRCQAAFSNEAVHDLRVATRRLLALIQLLNSISPRLRFRKMIRSFKGQLGEFNDLRDTQVILVTLSETLPGLPQLQEFQEHQQTIEEKLLKRLRKKVK